MPEERGKRKRRERSESLSDLMLKAQNFYIAELAKSQIGLSYLKERQISEATRQKFGLGYSPDNWQALEAVFGEKYSSKALEDCGLVITKDGHRYDRFRGRVMFPIRNPRGASTVRINFIFLISLQRRQLVRGGTDDSAVSTNITVPAENVKQK